MKELINYCPVDGYPSDIPRKQEVIQQFLQKTGIDGLELFLYCNKPLIHSYRETTVGVHLKYWPYWVEFWNGNTENLLHTLGTPEKIQEFYFGARNKDEWIVAIKENIKRALQEEPEYLVWHVSDSDNEEAFTYQFKHSDQEVIQATIEVFNQVSSVIPKTVTVLFENLWWPGMTLLNKELTANFFAELNCDNVGIMLDTGHLMNTNRSLRTEKEALRYICDTISALGSLKNKIQGIHLNSSLSGEYVQDFLDKRAQIKLNSNIMPHIIKIDQHLPWKTQELTELLQLIEVKYLVHELYYSNFEELESLIAKQKSLLK